VRAAVADREEVLAHADHADPPTVDLDDATAVPAYLVDCPHPKLHGIPC
jgi:hypothetical protein